MSTIAEKFSYLLETKNEIKQSIIDKGVSVSDSDTFRSYADKISAIQSGGGGSVQLGAYNRIGQPFVVGETCTSIYLNETLSLEEIFQILAGLPQTDIIMDMPCYKICEFTTGNILVAFYMEGRAICALTNADATDAESILLFAIGTEYVLAPALPNISYQVASIGSSNNLLSSFISNGEFTKGNIFTTKDTISGNYETKTLIYPDIGSTTQIDTIDKNAKTIVTQIKDLPLFTCGIKYSLATAQIEYYGMCQIDAAVADPYEEGIVFRNMGFGEDGVVPFGRSGLKFTKARVVHATFTVTFTFYYMDKTTEIITANNGQEVQIPIHDGNYCYRIDASETD